MATATDTKPANKSSSDQTVSRLESDRGVTSINSTVVEKVAAIAAREVEGVDHLGGVVTGAIANVVGRIRSEEHRTSGVAVEVGAKQAAVDLTITVRYPASIHQVADSVRQNVIDRIEQMTGLEVVEVNIAVTDLAFEGEQQSQRVQ